MKHSRLDSLSILDLRDRGRGLTPHRFGASILLEVKAKWNDVAAIIAKNNANGGIYGHCIGIVLGIYPPFPLKHQ